MDRVQHICVASGNVRTRACMSSSRADRTRSAAFSASTCDSFRRDATCDQFPQAAFQPEVLVDTLLIELVGEAGDLGFECGELGRGGIGLARLLEPACSEASIFSMGLRSGAAGRGSLLSRALSEASMDSIGFRSGATPGWGGVSKRACSEASIDSIGFQVRQDDLRSRSFSMVTALSADEPRDVPDAPPARRSAFRASTYRKLRTPGRPVRRDAAGRRPVLLDAGADAGIAAAMSSMRISSASSRRSRPGSLARPLAALSWMRAASASSRSCNSSLVTAFVSSSRARQRLDLPRDVAVSGALARQHRAHILDRVAQTFDPLALGSGLAHPVSSPASSDSCPPVHGRCRRPGGPVS